MTDHRTSIESNLKAFTSVQLRQASRDLLATLGYQSDKTIVLEDSKPQTFLNFIKEHNPAATFNEEKALVADWKSADLLFQFTDDEISGEHSLFKDTDIKHGQLRSYLFFAIELTGGDYARGKLTDIARQINRVFPMPVMVLIKHLADKKPVLSIAVINRRRNKTRADKDVLEKTTIIRDISLTEPHRGHLDILNDLVFDNLSHPQKLPINNFDTLHTAWEQIFNVELLNKNFYDELANWFFWAKKYTRFPLYDEAANNYDFSYGSEKAKEHATKNLIRLLTRILFVWFIKERELVPGPFFNPCDLKKTILKSFDPESKDTNYYKAVLQNLFFATLNQTHGEREFRKEGRQHQNTTTLLRYKDSLSSPVNFVQALEDSVPFLNGGLFECLDHPHPTKKGPQGGKVIVYEDGFSDRKDNPLLLPDFLFFGKRRTEDLSGEDSFGLANKRNAKVRGLIHILDNYKFTIVENTPIDQEIALDPELLGQVFENLLASYNPETKTTARKQTGSFYTPRPIVDYMVDESLKAHLTQALTTKAGMSEDGAKARLDILFQYREADPKLFESHQVETLIAAIDSCKILDPACGSGAFPMGALQKLVYVLSKLDPGDKLWEQRQLAKVDKMIEAAHDLDDTTFRDRAIADAQVQKKDIKEAFAKNELGYGRKLYLIESCLYGVDIQPIATQVTKLRFFISLIVDQRVERQRENFGVRPLPNLETKFVTADSLIQLEKSGDQLDFSETPRISDLKKKLKRVRHKIFSVKTPKTKEKYRKEEELLWSEIRNEVTNNGWPKSSADLLTSWKPYDQNASSPYFDPGWMFGVNEGFDIVIGNPPYLRIQGIKQANPKAAKYYKENYDAATGSFDIYVIFMERGMQLISETGILNFINPDKWVNASFGKGIRRFAIQARNVHKLISFGAHQIFSASTYSSLLWMRRSPASALRYARVDPNESKAASIEDELNKLEPSAFATISFDSLSEAPWILPTLESANAMGQILAIPRRTSDLFQIFVGLQTSKDSIYFLKQAEDNGSTFTAYSPELEEQVEIEKGLVKPLLLGNQVHRFENLNTTNLVVFPYNLPPDNGGKAALMSERQISRDYPKGWEYLKRCELVLRGREQGRFDNDEWYQFGRKQGISEGGTPKILAPDISLGGNFSIDRTGHFYTTTTLYGYIKHDKVWESYEFLLAVMNSKVLWFYLKTSGNALANGYFRYTSAYLKNFPIPEVSKKAEITISTLVKCMLAAKADGTSPEAAAFLENLIDACVMECYFPEHMAERDLLFLDDLALHLAAYDPEASGAKQGDFLSQLYTTLNASKHPIRNRLLRITLDSPDLLAVIKRESEM